MISALRYEWRRMISVRATWILLAVATAMTVLLAFLQITFSDIGSGFDGRQTLDAVLASAHNPISLTLISVVAAMTFGHEYRYGVIRLTLTALPRRGRVFAAKTVATILFALGAWAASLITALATALIMGSTWVRFRPLTARTRTAGDGDLGEWSSVFWNDLLRAAVYVVLYSLIVMALAAILRNLALGVIIALIGSTLVEGILLGFLESRVLWLNDLLPFTNGLLFLEWTPTGDPITTSGTPSDPMSVEYATVNPITPVRAGLVFTAWTAMLIAAAYALFDTRDA
jgi:ABC-2 type transport system permease protein